MKNSERKTIPNHDDVPIGSILTTVGEDGGETMKINHDVQTTAKVGEFLVPNWPHQVAVQSQRLHEWWRDVAKLLVKEIERLEALVEPGARLVRVVNLA